MTTALLEKFDAERHGDVKVLAASGWAKRIGHDQQAAIRAAERLTSLIQATGPAHEERRRAAFAALLVLGRAEVFAHLRERHGNAGPVRVSPDLLHRDLEFVRLVAEHWSTLKELLGNQLPTRLGGPEGSAKGTVGPWPSGRDGDAIENERTRPLMPADAQLHGRRTGSRLGKRSPGWRS